MQAHIGVKADGDPFQHQEQCAEQGELWGDGLAWHHELREEGGEDQDGFRVAGPQLDFTWWAAAFDPKRPVATQPFGPSSISVHLNPIQKGRGVKCPHTLTFTGLRLDLLCAITDRET